MAYERYRPLDQWQPFFTRGNGKRDGFVLPRAGWYFVDDRNVLSGPHSTRLDCEDCMRNAKQEFARS